MSDDSDLEILPAPNGGCGDTSPSVSGTKRGRPRQEQTDKYNDTSSRYTWIEASTGALERFLETSEVFCLYCQSWLSITESSLEEELMARVNGWLVDERMKAALADLVA